MKVVKWRPLLFITLLYCIPVFLSAQPLPDPGDDPDVEDPDEAVPFDGGIMVLLTAGVTYTLKKGYDCNKKRSSRK